MQGMRGRNMAGSRRNRSTAILWLVLAAACTPGPFPLRRRAPLPSTPPSLTVPWRTPVTAPLPAVADPGAVRSDSATIDRLVTFIRAWQLLTVWHPDGAAAQEAIDSAFVDLVPRLRVHGDAPTVRALYTDFVRPFGDPATRVIEDQEAIDTARIGTVSVDRTADSILVVRITDGRRYAAMDQARLRDAFTIMPSRLVLDLRMTQPGADPRAVTELLDQAGMLTRTGSTSGPPATWRRRRIGGASLRGGQWRPDDGWLVQEAVYTRVPPSKEAAPIPPMPPRMAILANGNSRLPPSLLTLPTSGVAASTLLIAEQTTGGDALSDAAFAPVVQLPIHASLTLRVRAASLHRPDGTSVLIPDALVEAPSPVPPTAIPAAGEDSTRRTDDSPAMRAALATLRGGAMLHPPGPRPVPHPATSVARDSTSYPDYGHRLLGAAILWSQLQLRHAHRELADEVNEDALRLLVTRVEAATNAAEYATALRTVANRVADGQLLLEGRSMDEADGPASLPFRVEWIEDRALITDVVSDSVTRALGITSGSELIAAEGFPLTAWMMEHRADVPAANDWSRQPRLMRRVMDGQPGRVLLRIREVNGRERTIDVPRVPRHRDQLPATERTGPVVRRLSDGVVYLDAQRLAAPWALDTLLTLQQAPAWIIDLRGAQRDSIELPAMLEAATRRRQRVTVAREILRYQTGPCAVALSSDEADSGDCRDERVTRLREALGSTQGAFRGRVAVLVDERTIGAAERLAVTLEGVADAMLIGSTTAGSPAETVAVPLPGGLTLHLPMLELRRADGGPWQRVGITPLVEARRTIRTTRIGGDDVIDRAQQWLVQQLELSPRRRR